MKKIIFIMTAIILVILSGCSASENVEKIEIIKIENSEVLTTITGQEDIDLFISSIKTAQKQDGIVDMVAPEYKVVVTMSNNETREYYFYINPDTENVSFLESDDTHYLYVIKKANARKLLTFF